MPEYTESLKKRDQSQEALNLASGEIVILTKKISVQEDIISDKNTQIDKKKDAIKKLDTAMKNSCAGRLIGSSLCKSQKNQKNTLSLEIRTLKDTVSSAEKTIAQLNKFISTQKDIIVRQSKLIARLSLFIDEYEACERQLKIQPTLSSPQMSGELHISGEVLVS